MKKAVEEAGYKVIDWMTRTKRRHMKGLIVVIAIVVAWYVLNRYVLPRFGVKT